MDKIRMDQEGVEALKNLAESLPEAVQAVSDAASNLRSSFEEKKEVLGPHTNDIEQILEMVDEAQSSGHGAIIKVQLSLIKSAAILAAIIDKGFSK